MLTTYTKNLGLNDKTLAELSKLTPPAHEKFQQWRKSEDAIFFDYAFRDDILKGIPEKAKDVASRFENVVVLGIGGSALGLRCAAQALLPPFWNILDRTARGNMPRLFVCDNIDPDTFSSLLALADAKKTMYVVISKSGKTTETAAQFFIVLDVLKKACGAHWREHLAIVTDPKAGELRPFVNQEKITSFEIPPKLGGRFSVISPVGLFPAACAGIDVAAMIEGARQMATRCSGPSIADNIAYEIGGAHYWLSKNAGKSISVMMPYSDALSLTSEWYAQLWAESLGKNGNGQTPVKALGATDQHSQVQLYMDGPNDKVFTIVGVENFSSHPQTTTVKEPSEAFSFIRGKDLGTILRAEARATTDALTKVGRPNLTVTFPKVDAFHLGEFFMMYEIATAFAGALSGIDPFDQPGVELGKKLTKEILS